MLEMSLIIIATNYFTTLKSDAIYRQSEELIGDATVLAGELVMALLEPQAEAYLAPGDWRYPGANKRFYSNAEQEQWHK